jgi:hypothetical protein
MSNIIQTYLKYASVQMASEARLDLFGNRTSEAALIFGNDRASKFTPTQAAEFSEDWEVVEHKSNTTTGFSGTLFKSKATGELVLSFRSTEFADDAVRDNQATNVLEIKEEGWAFGQIDDMRTWVDSLYASGKLSTLPITVTGYSLGGHLATAFNLLYPSAVAATYTFNGAGVGEVGIDCGLTQFGPEKKPIHHHAS